MDKEFDDFWLIAEDVLVGTLNTVCTLNIISEEDYFNALGEIEDGTFYMMVFHTLRAKNLV